MNKNNSVRGIDGNSSTKILRAAIYARKSNDDNDRNEVNKSVTRQVVQAKLYAQEMNWSLRDEHVYIDDGISGAEYVGRPGLMRLQDHLKDFDIVIVSEVSRIGRKMTWNAVVFDKFESNDVRLFCYMQKQEELLDSPEAKMMISMKSFGAEMERAQTGQRTRDAALRKFRQGYSTGGKCFGYKNIPVYSEAADGSQQRSHTEMQINTQEAEIIRQIFTMYADGYGQRTIAKTLNGDSKYTAQSLKYFHGTTPKATQSKDGTWVHTSIRAMLIREKYTGFFVYGKRKRVSTGGSAKGRKKGTDVETVELPHLRIISQDLWERVQARLAEAKKIYSYLHQNAKGGRTDSGRNSSFLLSGLATCECCGNSIIAGGSGSKKGKNKTYYYVCSHRHNRGTTACDNANRPQVDRLNEAVLSQINDKLLSDKAIEHVVDRALKLLVTKINEKSQDQQALFDTKSGLETELSNFMALVAQGVGSKSIGEAIVDREKRIAILTDEIQKTTGITKDALPSRRKLLSSARKELGCFRELMADSDVTVVRKAIATLLTSPDGTFTPLKVGRKKTPDRSSITFTGQLAAGRGFSTSGTEGRT